MAATFGMMSDAYFVSKSVLLNWINSYLQLNLAKVEECASGYVYCQLLDALYPGKVPMKKVDFSVRNNYDFVKNWKIVQEVFEKNGVPKVVPIDRIIKGRLQDNLEFLQWFYKFFNSVVSEPPEYDPVKRRKIARGGAEYNRVSGNMNAKKKNDGANRRRTTGAMKKNRTDSVSNRNSTSQRRSQTTAVASSSSRSSLVASSSQSKSLEKKTKIHQENNKQKKNNNSSSSVKRRLKLNNNTTSGNKKNNTNNSNLKNPQMLKKVKRLEQENVALKDKIKKLEDNFQSVYKTASDLERERDFYFSKALSMELILKNEAHSPLKTKLLEILYKSESGEAATSQSVENVITEEDIEMQQVENQHKKLDLQQNQQNNKENRNVTISGEPQQKMECEPKEELISKAII